MSKFSKTKLRVCDFSLTDLKFAIEASTKKLSTLKNPLEYIPVKPDGAKDYYKWKFICEMLEQEVLSRIVESEIGVEAEKLAEKEVN